MTNFIAVRLAELQPRLKGATLIAVSKSQDVQTIRLALAAGQRAFGENRVQEAQRKFPLLRSEYPDIELQLIGPLQTNKTIAAVKLFDVITTLDRPELAAALAVAIKKTNRRPRLYIEVNIGGEPQKTGVTPHQTGAFLSYCRDTHGLIIDGLMCIPPQGQDVRPFFRTMRQLANTLCLSHLSMGMSSDFEEAISCGATEVRIGKALFGSPNSD